jgi:predicted nucleic acid-binding protein
VVLVDTSVWVDHLRSGDARLSALLEKQQVLAHDFVIGEIALGNLRQRDAVITALKGLPRATRASTPEISLFIEQESLHGLGIGYVDAHLLASARLTAGAALWTRDKRLAKIAEKLGVAASAA